MSCEAHVVVIESPRFDGVSRIVQREKPVLVEAFLAELAMEALDVAVRTQCQLHPYRGVREDVSEFVWRQAIFRSAVSAGA
jgi:hypothetical protein